jgi:hypothetical protein
MRVGYRLGIPTHMPPRCGGIRLTTPVGLLFVAFFVQALVVKAPIIPDAEAVPEDGLFPEARKLPQRHAGHFGERGGFERQRPILPAVAHQEDVNTDFGVGHQRHIAIAQKVLRIELEGRNLLFRQSPPPFRPAASSPLGMIECRPLPAGRVVGLPIRAPLSIPAAAVTWPAVLARDASLLQ